MKRKKKIRGQTNMTLKFNINESWIKIKLRGIITQTEHDGWIQVYNKDRIPYILKRFKWEKRIKRTKKLEKRNWKDMNEWSMNEAVKKMK